MASGLVESLLVRLESLCPSNGVFRIPEEKLSVTPRHRQHGVRLWYDTVPDPWRDNDFRDNVVAVPTRPDTPEPFDLSTKVAIPEPSLLVVSNKKPSK